MITFISSRGRSDNLDSAGVHHDPDPLAHGLGRQVPGELGADGAGVTVSPGHLAPDHPHLRLGVGVGYTGLVLGLVHVGAPLADVPPSVSHGPASLDLEESSVLVLV